MLPHPLTNFEIQEYYQNELEFNFVYSKNNISKIKEGAYLINLDKHKSIECHMKALYLNDDNITYFHRFGVEEFKKVIGNKNTTKNIFRIQA